MGYPGTECLHRPRVGAVQTPGMPEWGDTLLLGAGLIGASFAIAAACWWVRGWSIGTRVLVLAAALAVTFVLPLLMPRDPVAVRGFVLLTCTLKGGKGLSLLHDISYWRGRTFRDWLVYLAIPVILVPRLHAAAPEPALRRDLLQLVGGLVATGAGTVLRVWAGSAERGAVAAWLDHFVKLCAVYLIVFDGMFVFAAGLLRLAGMRLLDLTRDPVLALTPADFWRRYNCEAGRLLREAIYRPLAPLVGTRAAVVGVFLVNGVFHEYLAWVMVGRVQGYQTVFFVLHAAATVLTWNLRPRGVTAAVARVLTVLFVVVTSVLFFGSMDSFVRWYSVPPPIPWGR